MLPCMTATLSAQGTAEWTKARQEIHENIRRSGSNYLAYPDPTEEDKLTPTPKGYEPFYLSHYGRHGSRWLTNQSSYSDILGVLQRAQVAGVLTERGKLLLEQMEPINEGAIQRTGDLSTVGEAQHHRIGKRLAKRFPEIFCRPETQIDARSTIVRRCILSMTAACEELAAANPKARIHNDTSQSLQYYLNAPWSEQLTADDNARKQAVPFDYDHIYIHPEAFWARLFTDTTYRDPLLEKPSQLMTRVFAVCSNQQSHEPYLSLYDLLTEEECYDLWKWKNIGWYIDYAQGTAPFTQTALLENIIATADTITGSKTFRGATLRYGHDTCVMPLSALLEVGNCYPEVPAEGLDTLDRVWADYRIFPMGSNIQLVFYRPKKGEGDILVKALQNERETTLPGTPVTGPYYRWNDLRDYYLRKIAAYKATLN